jgi:hypothetical protein
VERSIFSDDWRECLREHYKYVVRNEDQTTLRTLVPVLQSEYINFSEEELRQLYIEATMRADELPDGFLPSPEFAAEQTAEQSVESPVNPAHPLECQCPACVGIDLVPHDEEGQPLDADALAELEERQAAEARKDDPDSPAQLTLF